jgi:hypothetical protein
VVLLTSIGEVPGELEVEWGGKTVHKLGNVARI